MHYLEWLPKKENHVTCAGGVTEFYVSIDSVMIITSTLYLLLAGFVIPASVNTHLYSYAISIRWYVTCCMCIYRKNCLLFKHFFHCRNYFVWWFFVCVLYKNFLHQIKNKKDL